MKILVVGSGGREHALAWKLSQEATVICTPGNPGMAQVGECVSGDPVEIAVQQQVDLVVVGPEMPLIEGLADKIREKGIPVFGPDKIGAQLEGSKAFSKDLMTKAGVPTAEYQNFTCSLEAKKYAKSFYDRGSACVVKASGAAFGKGAVVCPKFEDAEFAITDMMDIGRFGDAGKVVVVEEFMQGREFSLLTVCSDEGFLSLPVAQDYKRIFEGDEGPNTGGVGSYCPAAWVTPDVIQKTEETIVAPILKALKEEGATYRGVLFTGVMVTENGPRVIEYNVRFGDPETQSVMRRMGKGFANLLLAAAKGEPLPEVEILEDPAVTVVLCSSGYPDAFEKNKQISIPNDLNPSVVLFHAGTTEKDGVLITSGGRVLGVSATGKDFEEAKNRAYEAVNCINFEGKYFRRDIASSVL